MLSMQVAADVQGVAADVVAGAHMQRPQAELRQRRAGAPAAEGAAAAAGPQEGAPSFEESFYIVCRPLSSTSAHLGYHGMYLVKCSHLTWESKSFSEASYDK